MKDTDQNTKELLKCITMSSLPIFVILIAIAFFYFQFKYLTENFKNLSFVSEIYYLKKRSSAALFYTDKINNVEELKMYIEKDDEKIADFRKRKLIDEYSSSYSSLQAFKENKKSISSENDELWIDYSTHKIENGIYIVEVSSEVCDVLNQNTFKNSRKCLNNIYTIDLNTN